MRVEAHNYNYKANHQILTDATITMGDASQAATALLTEHLQYTPLVRLRLQ